MLSSLMSLRYASLFSLSMDLFLYGPGGLNGTAAPFFKSLCGHPKRTMGLPRKELIGSAGVGFLSQITR